MGEHKRNNELFIKCPTGDKACATCKFWLREKEGEYALVNGGQWMPMEELRALAVQQGKIASTAGMATAQMAWCAESPRWNLMAREQWCHRWSPRLAS